VLLAISQFFQLIYLPRHFGNKQITGSMTLKKFIALAAMAAVSSIGYAQEAATQQGLHWVVGADAGGGGDTLVPITYTNGTSQAIKSGNGVQFKGGFTYTLNPSLTLLGTLGYEYETTNASNGNVTFSRWPVEALGLWKLSEKVRLGGGMRIATNAKLSGSGVASSLGTTSFQGKMGVVLQGEYLFTAKDAITLRFIKEQYDVNSVSVNADHAQVGYSHYF
jgi:hypothetical protein